ncbi:flagellar basal body-associated FliL family protein [Acetivibrio clariflavus]|uniref:Flagellar protein FliL n=1 Tax=Acetivibrio clariflavus (strain DSM 19732 / NBRC 101661 / EBR45) TaxID=720554 RepID=G8LVG8_ACECE|nr:flagellar basal body-associated FliL family protein [Acetivibrio clariflavus]AEV68557.1 flagellar basal body-associated protein [Acetivibrio clariflavus DSM 19732]HOQ00974.1 flagellar basal body-associated FliL family protein [Acetivibrio clariflavus]HPU40934.1 flagellar basal body-associated FliL family protein [Acetivibrio clariflavus]
MEGKSTSFIILICVVAFLSLALALLSGYVLFMGGSSKGQAANNKTITVPKDSELAVEQIFSSNTAFNLKTTNNDKNIHVILVSAQIQYFAKFEGIKDTTAKIQANKGKLAEMVGTYFQNLTIDDVKKPEAKEKARSDLKKMMNEYLLQNEEANGELVYSIIFDYWFYQ